MQIDFKELEAVNKDLEEAKDIDLDHQKVKNKMEVNESSIQINLYDQIDDMEQVNYEYIILGFRSLFTSSI